MTSVRLADVVKRRHRELEDLRAWLDQLVMEQDMLTRSRDNWQREAERLVEMVRQCQGSDCAVKAALGPVRGR